MRKKARWDKVVVWSAFLLCAGQSILFNVLHANMSSDSALAAGSAIIWPLAAVLGVEILARVHFARGRMWTFARFGCVGLCTVGAMVISYVHTFDVLMSWHEPVIMAAVGPLVVDGLMTLSGAALLAMATTPRRVRRKTPARKRSTARKPTTATAPRLATVAAV